MDPVCDVPQPNYPKPKLADKIPSVGQVASLLPIETLVTLPVTTFNLVDGLSAYLPDLEVDDPELGG